MTPTQRPLLLESLSSYTPREVSPPYFPRLLGSLEWAALHFTLFVLERLFLATQFTWSLCITCTYQCLALTQPE